MTTEEKLKDLIRHRYHSIREFAIKIDMPYSTLDSIFKRGSGNSSVTNIIKICKALKISADALAEGEFVSIATRPTTPVNEYIEIKESIEDIREALTHSGFITLDGRPLNRAGAESLIDTLELGVELAKKKNS